MGGTERLFYFSDFMNYSLAENRFFPTNKIKPQINTAIKNLHKSLIISNLQNYTRLFYVLKVLERLSLML